MGWEELTFLARDALDTWVAICEPFVHRASQEMPSTVNVLKASSTAGVRLNGEHPTIERAGNQHSSLPHGAIAMPTDEMIFATMKAERRPLRINELYLLSCGRNPKTEQMGS